jgi:hypothetical protein
VKVFRMGVQLGDPDSMVSLAEMIGRGRTVPMNASETKLALYERAARLGHEGAAQALRVEQENELRAEQERKQQLEQQRRAMESFQLLLQNIPRR